MPELTWLRRAGPLTLRPPTPEDLDQVLTWRNSPDVTRWLLQTTVEPEAYKRAWLAEGGDVAVVAHLDGQVVGAGSLGRIADTMGQGHLGYTIYPAPTSFTASSPLTLDAPPGTSSKPDAERCCLSPVALPGALAGHPECCSGNRPGETHFTGLGNEMRHLDLHALFALDGVGQHSDGRPVKWRAHGRDCCTNG